ncbi:MAG: glucuronyl hydrolase [Chitinophagaceae bacterium]|nr:glucuronyl hydrolase [Chitinophagaceae bacterium]
MKKIFLISGLSVLFFINCSTPRTASNNSVSRGWINQNLAEAASQYKLLKANLPAGQLPRSTFENGTLRTCTSENWVSGFYPGTLVYLYETIKDTSLWNEAVRSANLLSKEQYNTGTHDLGFMMYCSYGNLYRLTNNEQYKQVLINSAKSLITRFNPAVGCIRSWGKSDDTKEFRVIIDNMMNLELLFRATELSGDSSFYKIAVTHANTTIRNHFRPDYSSYHVVNYNPLNGSVIYKKTAQGAADESAWARGQSWGLYGFTVMYRFTHDKKYLDQAQHIAQFLINHPNLPADKIPYWDYNAPGIPNAIRDASSGAILASALIELAGYSDKQQASNYRDIANTILKSLSAEPYKAAQGTNAGFILKHSVGSLPGKADVDVALNYADYYYVEALNRLKNLK